MKNTQTILILDDEQEIIDYLSKTIHELFDNFEIISFTDFDSFFESIDNISYQYVIADVFFKDVNSINKFNKITKNGRIPLIYMSGADEDTFDVYETPHEYFLKKPIDPNKLEKALAKIISQHQYITIKNHSVEYTINTKEIYYLESDRRIVNIVTKDNTYFTYSKLDSFEAKLPKGFFRVSKSYIVNKRYIKERSASEIILINGEKIPISRSRRGVFDAI